MALGLIVVARHVRRARAAQSGSSLPGPPRFPPCGWTAPRAVRRHRRRRRPRCATTFFAATLALAALLSVRHLDAEHVPPGEFYALLLLASTGMMLAASAAEFVVLYLGLELMTLCSYVLVGITRDRPTSNEAAIRNCFSWARSHPRCSSTGSASPTVSPAPRSSWRSHRRSPIVTWGSSHCCSSAWRSSPRGWPSRSPRCHFTPGRRTPTRERALRSRPFCPPGRRPPGWQL